MPGGVLDEKAPKRVTGDPNGAETACKLSVEADFREPCALIHAADICITRPERYSFNRLCVRHTSVHSACTFSSPRRLNCRHSLSGGLPEVAFASCKLPGRPRFGVDLLQLHPIPGWVPNAPCLFLPVDVQVCLQPACRGLALGLDSRSALDAPVFCFWSNIGASCCLSLLCCVSRRPR